MRGAKTMRAAFASDRREERGPELAQGETDSPTLALARFEARARWNYRSVERAREDSDRDCHPGDKAVSTLVTNITFLL